MKMDIASTKAGHHGQVGRVDDARARTRRRINRSRRIRSMRAPRVTIVLGPMLRLRRRGRDQRG